jgi:hypothetical protein
MWTRASFIAASVGCAGVCGVWEEVVVAGSSVGSVPAGLVVRINTFIVTSVGFALITAFRSLIGADRIFPRITAQCAWRCGVPSIILTPSIPNCH